MKRTAMRRKPRPVQDRVTPELWNDVVARDAQILWLASEGRLHHGQSFSKWLATMRMMKRAICVIVFLDPNGSGTCSGSQEVDHFWLIAGGVKGKRAPSDKYHLVASCHYHNVDRPPSADVRTLERAYVKKLYGDELPRL